MSGLGWTLQTAWTIYGMFSAKKQLFIKRNKDINKSEGTQISIHLKLYIVLTEISYYKKQQKQCSEK
jgi:hypothetical protein